MNVFVVAELLAGSIDSVWTDASHAQARRDFLNAHPTHDDNDMCMTSYDYYEAMFDAFRPTHFEFAITCTRRIGEGFFLYGRVLLPSGLECSAYRLGGQGFDIDDEPFWIENVAPWYGTTNGSLAIAFSSAHHDEDMEWMEWFERGHVQARVHGALSKRDPNIIVISGIDILRKDHPA